MKPEIQPTQGEYNENILRGLDFALAALAARRMTAVLTLNNMWQWSGGFASYVAWATGEPAPRMGPGATDSMWQVHQNFALRFYSLSSAQDIWRSYLHMLLLRRNTVTGVEYRSDPTIMAWQLCNEPRALSAGVPYRAWIRETTDFLRQLDKNHLISLGSEGLTPYKDYVGNHLVEDHMAVDYATIHIWPQNWDWYDPSGDDSQKSLDAAWSKSVAYLDAAVESFASINKPLVVEEFGLARDGGSYSLGSSTHLRDEFYRRLCSKVTSQKGQISGLNFWAWGGEGRPSQPKSHWQPGDSWTGDPPHELQGWYSVYDKDSSTVAVIRECARQMEVALS
jgi:mannan endo-1,4-beta-mannosidase